MATALIAGRDTVSSRCLAVAGALELNNLNELEKKMSKTKTPASCKLHSLS
jgi:hypothetical protein